MGRQLSHRLARQIGLNQAMGVVLRAEPVSADDGYRRGFVNEVVPPERLDETVAAWVGATLQGAPTAIAASKQAIMRGLDEPSLEQVIKAQRDYEAFATWRTSGEP